MLLFDFASIWKEPGRASVRLFYVSFSNPKVILLKIGYRSCFTACVVAVMTTIFPVLIEGWFDDAVCGHLQRVKSILCGPFM